MQKIKQLILVLAFTGLGIGLRAQTTILDQTLLTQQSFDTFTAVSVTGAQEWSFSSQYGAMCSGFFSGQSNANEDWFISPAMNLSQVDNVKLTFSHARGPESMINVGVSQGWYKAFATASYTGNPATTAWVELTGINQNITQGWQYVSSGDLIIPDAAMSAQTRIAFRYMSSNSQSATWEIKNVKVTGQQAGTASFKVTNWNTEWLGCTQYGPEDEQLQLNNVAAAMLAMNSDVYCLQEVSNTPSGPTIAALVSILGSSQWGGAISPSDTGHCNQRQGIIYKKSTVHLVSSSELSNGNSAQGNPYYFNWSGGRYPSVYNVNFISGSTSTPVSLVNIHAKAEDDDAASYYRRKGGSEGLKGILDGAAYNTKNVIIIGDFNDYLVGTNSDACNCSASPYKNFIDDAANYNGITKDITDVVTNWGIRPLIENIIISNELNDNYVTGSAAQVASLPGSIQGYYYTTSNHLPVTAAFQFQTMGSEEIAATAWAVYPNPVKNELRVTMPDVISDTAAAVYDLTGRQVFAGELAKGAINVSAIPAGIYILQLDGRSQKFIKE
ncbi:T9SS type A sorting domain-containing protein [uncultured Flavobacterium sp.]|uniref:T9SS-dependent choice-of-anchor J family protein n=1 Tax=uncultured Flavobacterium sp. TaxID=165435 RepID=UPI0025E26143|nr:T9SS type A sorting domain-containing protein [uncultured Flavobacterium sp.]